MAPRQPKSALQRKLALAREGGRNGGRTGGRSALRALRQAAGRAARDTMNMTLTVIGAIQSCASQDDLGRSLEDGRLLILLDGPDGLTGGATLDLPLVSALIQQQTTGTISASAAQQRRFTDTDAALVAPLIESLLARAADLTQLAADRACLTGYGYGARVEDAHSLALALEAESYRVFDLTIDIASGLHQGTLGLILAEREVPEPIADSAQGNDAKRFRQSDRIMAAPAELTAILCRLHLPLAKLTAMKPGDRLPLLPHRIERTELQTISGQFLAAGRLGQSDGFRAIRVNESELPQVPAPAAEPEPKPGPGPERVPESLAVAQLAQTETGAGGVQLPAEVAGPEENDAEALELLDAMTPTEAAAEISQLADLPITDPSGPEPRGSG